MSGHGDAPRRSAVLPGLDGEHGPAADADPVAVAERDGHADRDVAVVDLGAVRGAGVQDRPVAVGISGQDGVQAGDSGVGGRPGQVDLGFEPARRAAPSDAHLPPVQPEPALRAVGRKLDRPGVLSPGRDHAVEVGAIGGNHRRPG